MQTAAWRSRSARDAQMPPAADRLLKPSQVLPPLSRFAGLRTLIWGVWSRRQGAWCGVSASLAFLFALLPATTPGGLLCRS